MATTTKKRTPKRTSTKTTKKAPAKASIKSLWNKRRTEDQTKGGFPDDDDVETDGSYVACVERANGGVKDGNITYMDGELSPQGLEEAVAITAAVREAVGPQIEVLIDAHGRYNVPTAIQLANALAPYNIHWFEEPVPVESYSALKQVREKITSRISVGERLHTRFEFVPIFENNLADYIMPDVTWTGGISELKKISTMAEAFGRAFAALWGLVLVAGSRSGHRIV